MVYSTTDFRISSKRIECDALCSSPSWSATIKLSRAPILEIRNPHLLSTFPSTCPPTAPSRWALCPQCWAPLLTSILDDKNPPSRGQCSYEQDDCVVFQQWVFTLPYVAASQAVPQILMLRPNCEIFRIRLMCPKSGLPCESICCHLGPRFIDEIIVRDRIAHAFAPRRYENDN